MKYLLYGLLAALLPLSAQAGEAVTYKSGGAEYEGYRTKAVGKSKGQVVIIHDWDGLTDYEVKRSEMLSKMGYDVFALDLFGKGNRPKERAAKKALTGALRADTEKMRTLILAGLAEARKSSPKTKLVVAGYCFGGGGVLELARSGRATDIAGYVTFHGTLKKPEGQSYPKGTPPMLIAHGGGDTSVTFDHVAALSKELEATKIKYEVQIYSEAPHAFTVFGSGRYRKVADERSWEAFGDFLKVNLGG